MRNALSLRVGGPVTCHGWIMCIAIEYLNVRRVLLLRVYAHWKVTERRNAVKNVTVHGCYHAGIPILIDSTEVAPDVLPDVDALRAALASSLHDSRIAILVSPGRTPLPEPVTPAGAVFSSREDALHWLTAPGE